MRPFLQLGQGRSTPPAWRSTQPTTPATRSLEAASESSSGVSPGSITVWTTTVAVTPAASASGRKSASE